MPTCHDSHCLPLLVQYDGQLITNVTIIRVKSNL
jgi:hypothetical protein